MELVDDDRAESHQEWIGLQARGQNPFGRHQNARGFREFTIEANVPARLFAQRPPALRRDPPRERSRGESPRLQHDDGALLGERRGHARRLSSARRRDDDGGAMFANQLANRVEVRVDGEGVEHRASDHRIPSAATIASPIAPVGAAPRATTSGPAFSRNMS